MPLAVVAEIHSRRGIVGLIGPGAIGGVATLRRDRDRGAIVIIIAVVVVVAGIVIARAAVIGVAAANRGADGDAWPETATAAMAITATPSIAAPPISTPPIPPPAGC